MFVSGLRMGVPWEHLVAMRLPCLVMMLESTRPPKKRKGRKGVEVREATQADIDSLLG